MYLAALRACIIIIYFLDKGFFKAKSLALLQFYLKAYFS